MTTTQLRRQIKKRIDALPEERLPFAAEFVRYLDEYAGEHTLEEANKIAAMKERIDQAERDFAEGRSRNWREIRNDV